jgi:hypothetical protein
LMPFNPSGAFKARQASVRSLKPIYQTPRTPGINRSTFDRS